MLEKFKNEPVMVLVVLVAVALTVLVQTGTITIEQIDGAVATFWKVLAIVVLVAGGLAVRAKVTPTRKG